MDYTLLSQLALNGVLLGLVYGLVGLGLSLVLGVMGVINISHGAFYMLGGYIAFVGTQQLGYSPLIAVLVATGFVFVLGVAVDRAIVNTVSNDETSVMMITFGLAIILGRLVLIATKGNPFAPRPLSRSVLLFGQLYSQSEIVIAALTGVGITALTILFLRKSKIGKAMRMLSQNKEMSRVLGVVPGRLSAFSLGLGSCFAHLAGALLTPIYLDYPDAQWQPLVAAFVVVVVGGLGSVSG